MLNEAKLLSNDDMIKYINKAGNLLHLLESHLPFMIRAKVKYCFRLHHERQVSVWFVFIIFLSE